MNSSSPSVRRALAIVAAVVGAVVIYLIGSQLVDGGIKVDSGGSRQTITVVAVILGTVVVGLVGWGLLALLERFAAKARTIWVAIAVVVLLISVLGPLGGVTAGAKITLFLLHLVVAAAIIPVFARTSTRR